VAEFSDEDEGQYLAVAHLLLSRSAPLARHIGAAKLLFHPVIDQTIDGKEQVCAVKAMR
jgi:hypothetical protein